jgi:hypothetical protein
MRDAVESMEPAEKRCDIDNAKRWAQPESREDRVNHFARGLDAIRDSRIAFQDGFRDTP